MLLAAAAATLAGCQTATPVAVQPIRLGGSQIPVELVENWLKTSPSPAFTVERIWPLRSAADGFSQLQRGTCDLACVDRPMTLREAETFADQPLTGLRTGFYGFALYVSSDNPLDAIYVRHLEAILQGKVTAWEQLVGEQIATLSGPITVYGLGKSTRAGMQLSYMARIFFNAPTWIAVESDAEILARVRDDPHAIGFAAIGHDGDGLRYLGLRMQREGRASYPSLEEIESERFGLAKIIYLYYRPPATPTVVAALDYLFSPGGQAAQAATEVWPLPRDRAQVLPVP